MKDAAISSEQEAAAARNDLIPFSGGPDISSVNYPRDLVMILLYSFVVLQYTTRKLTYPANVLNAFAGRMC